MTAPTNKVRTNMYLNKQIKAKAQLIFKEYGISLSDAVNMFLRQSVYEQGIPFDLKIPTKKLELEIINPQENDYKLIQEAKKARQQGEQLHSIDDIERMLAL